MRKNFVKKLALGLAFTLTISSVPAANAAAAKAYPSFNSIQANLKVGQTKKYGTYNSTAWSFYQFKVDNETIATAKHSRKGKFIKITGVKAGITQIRAYFKNYKTKEEYKNAVLKVTVKADVVKDAAIAYFANAKENVNKYSISEIFTKMDANEEMLIIDIRDAVDYEKEHLKGAVNIPYAEIGKSLELIPDDIPVYVNCYSGQTASQTIALLNVAGKKAGNIQSGYNAIAKTEGYEKYVETTVNELPDATYPVDSEIKKAIVNYYEDAAASKFGKFNMPVAALAELVEAGSDEYTIVDIRDASAYAAGHIKGAAINIPFGIGMQASFDKIPTDKPVVVCCFSGQTASQTMAILRLLGYEAYNLSGGMTNGWLANELPVVTD